MNIQAFILLTLCVVLIRLIKMAFTKKRKSFEDEAAEFTTQLVLTCVFYTVFCLAF